VSRILALAGMALALSGCGAMPVWLGIAGPALSYVASVNNLGAETLRFIERRPADTCPVPVP